MELIDNTAALGGCSKLKMRHQDVTENVGQEPNFYDFSAIEATFL